MAQRKLKGYVLPTIYTVCISIILISLISVVKNLKPTNIADTDYVMNTIIDSVEPVINEVNNDFIKPYNNDNVIISKGYYSKDASEENQQNSLIYYENTYLQNNGIVYSNNDEFEIVAANDGIVLEVKQDEILNTIVYLKHENEITTIYYGLKDVSLKANDQVYKGTVIGKSTANKFCESNNSFLFEVNINGKTTNPEEFLANKN